MHTKLGILFLALFGAISFLYSNGEEEKTCKKGKGSLHGTAAFFEKDEFAGDAAHVVVELRKGKEIVKFVTDDFGDYWIDLKPGNYVLMRVLDANSVPLDIFEDQHRSFKVKKNQSTRFDVMLKLPSKDTGR